MIPMSYFYFWDKMSSLSAGLNNPTPSHYFLIWWHGRPAEQSLVFGLKTKQISIAPTLPIGIHVIHVLWTLWFIWLILMAFLINFAELPENFEIVQNSLQHSPSACHSIITSSSSDWCQSWRYRKDKQDEREKFPPPPSVWVLLSTVWEASHFLVGSNAGGVW